MLRTPPDRSVDPLTVAVLRVVDRVLGQTRTPYFLVGATARDLLLWNVFGLPIERATRDIDLAIAAESWRAFGLVKQALLATGEFNPDVALLHRLYHSPPDPHRGYPVDIVPFGGLESDSGRIEWPPDQDIRMTVLGFEESLAASSLVQIADDLAVPVPSLPSLAVLKLFAWHDRRHTPKDALDLALLMRTYSSTGNEERLYGSAFNMMEAANFDIRLAGARLLGVDVRACLKPRTAAALAAILSDPRLRGELVLHMVPACRGQADPLQLASALLDQFIGGLAVV
jgi:predicted nucleotidyltransferase